MTICVAAIAANRMVIGASDRMLTASDIQFEPPQTKVYELLNTIAIMVSGDAVLNDEILKGVEKDKRDGMSVLEVAESYRAHYQKAFLRRVEDSILSPLNLNRKTFLNKQKHMEPGLVSQIATEILRFEPSPEGVGVIVAGVDKSGPHLYVVTGSDIGCYDTIGFCAVGSGSWHAQSQLMFTGHISGRPIPETMLAVYWAKKRAEVAPHVGVKTDMFSIAVGSNPIVFRFPPDMLDKLDEIYQASKEQENQARLVAEGGFNEYINRLTTPQAQVQKASEGGEEDNVGSPPTDGGEDRGNSAEREEGEG